VTTGQNTTRHFYGFDYVFAYIPENATFTLWRLVLNEPNFIGNFKAAIGAFYNDSNTPVPPQIGMMALEIAVTEVQPNQIILTIRDEPA
jgi:hypothetical protein